jgi:20S proteasome subunit alpha 2
MGDMNFSLTTFNKTGKLLQIEYALNRVQQGKMALGIKGMMIAHYELYMYNTLHRVSMIEAKNGVVIATDKKVSSVLVEADGYQKMQSITPSTGIISTTTIHYSLILTTNIYNRVCIFGNGS